MVIYMSDNNYCNNSSNNSSNVRNTLSEVDARRSVDDFFGDDTREGLSALREDYDFGVRNGLKRIIASKNEE